MRKVIFTSFFVFIYFLSQAQERCGTVAYEKLLQQRNPRRENIDQFENWMRDKLMARSKTLKSGRQQTVNYVVSIVVHVIHNGEAVGTGTNISDAQILSQIKVLNDDFERLNADSVNTPSEFKSVAGKFTITFVMAKQDPNGLATNGIVRVKGTQTSWSITDNYALKALSYWPAEDYLNLWIANLSGGLLGYTQLPVTTTLQGLEEASYDRLTDGVVVHYKSYGTSQATGGGSFNLLSGYDLGRTATHEIGHFFGLRHVWGDVSNCSGTDYVADTPTQDKDYNGTCPSTAQVDCSGDSMYSNYMNYTDDACMNIFSKGQVGRMDVIINNSPRRASLLNSIGSQLPSPVANDLGIKSSITPAVTACDGNLTPNIVIRNYGTNSITSAQIQLLINGNSIETKDFALSLASTSETNVSFSAVSLSAATSYNFSFKVLSTNGGSDGNPANDQFTITTVVPALASLPLFEAFDTTPTWQITNPDGLTTWSNIATAGSNHAMYIDFYNYADQQGAMDWIATPIIDLTTAPTASINFDYAYATFQGGSNDRLRVLVSSVCDFNSSPVEIFNKSGSALATAVSTSTAFTPSSSQWTTVSIPLTQFLGQRIQIAFEGINDYGNNLYIDNVSVVNIPITSLTLSKIVTPSPVSCLTIVAPVIRVTNTGNTLITSFVTNTVINNEKVLRTQTISGLQLSPGSTADFSLNIVGFNTGNNLIAVTISSVNGISNASSGNTLSTAIEINAEKDLIPLRQNFNDTFLPAWSTISPSSGQTWFPASTNYSISMIFNSFTNTSVGEQAWLVSPVLDFSDAKTAGVFYQSSYAYRAAGSETLEVYSSTDCGETFEKVIQTSSGAALSNTTSTSAWVPANASDWRTNYINLDDLAGKQNVRLAFVATNGNGNNLYLDNIEFFVDDNESPISIKNQYSVYGGLSEPVKITFNLPERQQVRLQAYDILGHVVSDNLLPETLNQTYTLDFPTGANGLYIIRVQTANGLGSTKVLIGY